jgi:Rab-like protein 2
MTSQESKSSSPRSTDNDPSDLKLILLGDSAVGKSKLAERYLMDDYNPRQDSTYALTLYRKNFRPPNSDDDSEVTKVDFWDTAGQERFNSMHPSYYYQAHVCVLVFDVTRKQTYTQLKEWYRELRQYCPDIPCILVANKIDVDYQVTKKNFKFAAQNNLPFFFVSAADGTNVVKVFDEAVREGMVYKQSGKTDFVTECLELFDDSPLNAERK